MIDENWHDYLSKNINFLTPGPLSTKKNDFFKIFRNVTQTEVYIKTENYCSKIIDFLTPDPLKTH